MAEIAMLVVASVLSFLMGVFATCIYFRDNIPMIVKEVVEGLRKDGVL